MWAPVRSKPGSFLARARAVPSGTYVTAVIVLYLLTAIMGGYIYTNYRIAARFTLEQGHFWKTFGAFELKEHFIALGLGVLPAYWYFWRSPDTVFDELWGFTSERSRRLWDECVFSPARKISCRLTTTYAGFEGKSELLEDLYKRGLAQPQLAPDLRAGDGVLMFWSLSVAGFGAAVAGARRAHGRIPAECSEPDRGEVKTSMSW